MKRLQLLIRVLLLFVTSQSMAQTDPLWTLFNQNRLFHNAALAGIEDDKVISFSYRNQWPQIMGGPRTWQLSFEKPWQMQKAAGGMGAYILHNGTNTSSKFRVGLMGNYCIRIAEKTKIRLGLNAYYHTYYLDISKLQFSGPPPILRNNPVGSYAVSPAISFEHKNLLAGASLNYFRYHSVFSDYAKWYGNWYGYAAWMTHLTDNFEYKPSVIMRYAKPLDPNFDINNTIMYKQRIEAGVTYRGFNSNTNPVCFNIGLRLMQQRLRLAYAYDMPNPSINWPANSHEAQVSFRF